MSDWLEHTVQVEVEAPIDLVWSLWSDLEQMPRWMKWIDSVKIPPDNPDISLWKLKTGQSENLIGNPEFSKLFPTKLSNGNRLMVCLIRERFAFTIATIVALLK